MACSPSTTTHLLDDKYKFPSQIEVLAFPEPFSFLSTGAMAKWLRYRSREQKVLSSSPCLDISVEVTSQC